MKPTRDLYLTLRRQSLNRLTRSCSFGSLYSESAGPGEPGAGLTFRSLPYLKTISVGLSYALTLMLCRSLFVIT